MNGRRILFLDTVHPILQQNLEKDGFVCDEDYSCSLEDLKRKINEYHGLVIRSRFVLNEDILKHATNLKFIARSGSGMENIDVKFAESKGIVCLNSPEGNRDAVGEHVIGMLLTLLNKINTSDLQVRKAQWLREENRGIEIGGKTIGIIGYGNTGSALTKKLSGFECKVIAYDKYKTEFSDAFVKEVDLQSIYDHSDIVSLHIPYNIDNQHFANDLFFENFKKNIYFVNTSRGGVLNTKALVKALKTGKVLGACIDVLEYEKKSFEQLNEESLPEEFKYLVSSKNVILTPHVAGWTVESYEKLSSVLYKKISALY